MESLDVGLIAARAREALAGANLVDETIARNTQLLLLCEVVTLLREIRGPARESIGVTVASAKLAR